MSDKFVYAMKERIGNPDLFTGRKKELKIHLEWVQKIEEESSNSIAILSRRKSGKTVLLHRLYNIIWNQRGNIIPFYIEMEEGPKWVKDFSQEYYSSFLSQYYGFKLEKPEYVRESLFLDRIKEVALSLDDKVVLANLEKFEGLIERDQLDSLFSHVIGTPHALASLTGDFFVVMIDEFQYMNEYIFWDKAKSNQAVGIVGAYHGLSESKIAPMCVAGSYVGWLRQLISDYFQGGRLRERPLSPRLTPEEGLVCVNKYSELRGQPVSETSAEVMNELTRSDPFYISCIFGSYYENKDLQTAHGVVDAFAYEIRDRGSGLNIVWREYISRTLSQVNDRHARSILLFLSKNREQEWTRKEIKEHLNLEMSDGELDRKLKMLVKGDLIGQGTTDYDYRGIPDDIFDLIFRSLFQKEIDDFTPDVKTELMEEMALLRQKNKELQGKLGNLEGHLPEYLLSRELKTRKKTRPLSERVQNYQDGTAFVDYRGVYVNYWLNIEDARSYEIDVFAWHPKDLSLVFELKKQKGRRVGRGVVEEFLQKLDLLARDREGIKLQGIFLSQAGFTQGAIDLMEEAGIMYGDFQKWFETVY